MTDRRAVLPASDGPAVLPASEWAARVADELAARVRAQPGLRLCLPTGDTPSPVYAALPEALARAGTSLGRATIVQLDEWLGLSVGDPARCDTRLRAELLDRLEPRPAVQPIRVDELSPEAAAAAHDEIAAAGLHVVVLGLGMNGHVGFNEPGSTADSPTRTVVLDRPTLEAAVSRYRAGRTPTGGITLGMDRILEAGEVWLLATGERKAQVLQRTLEEPETPDCPASFLRRHARLRVLVDEPAAALLSAAASARGARV